ncbi:MAG: hypothetical protein ACE5KW_01855, partial [Dehalococcoidia bacterium]
RQASRLRPLLTAAAAARDLRIAPPSRQAVAAGENALLAEVARRRSRIEAGQASHGWGFLKPLASLGAASALALVALFAVAGGTDLLRDGSDFGATTSEATEFSGSVTSVGKDSFEVEIADRDTPATVVLRSTTTVAGGDGSPGAVESIITGSEVVILGSEDRDGVIRAERVNIRAEGDDDDHTSDDKKDADEIDDAKDDDSDEKKDDDEIDDAKDDDSDKKRAD